MFVPGSNPRSRGPANARLRASRGRVDALLDANASEPLRPEAKAAMNAASRSRQPVVGARRGPCGKAVDGRCAGTDRHEIGAREQDWSSLGGTEANALAVHALGPDRRIIICATEHDSIRAAAPHAAILPVDRDGVADLEILAAWLASGSPALVCLMLANNETGTIQPSRKRRRCAAAWCTAACRRGAGAGRISVDLTDLGCHSLALSATNWGVPARRRCTARRARTERHRAMILGGGQERGGEAARRTGRHRRLRRRCDLPSDRDRLSALRDRAEAPRRTMGRSYVEAAARGWPIRRQLALPASRRRSGHRVGSRTGFAVSGVPRAVQARFQTAMC